MKRKMSLISHLEEQYGKNFREQLSDKQKEIFYRRDKFLLHVLECQRRGLTRK